MGFWNYRVVRDEHEGEEWFALHEAHYDDDQRALPPAEAMPTGLSNPATLVGDSVDQLRMMMALALGALDKPVLAMRDGKVVRYE